MTLYMAGAKMVHFSCVDPYHGSALNITVQVTPDRSSSASRRADAFFTG